MDYKNKQLYYIEAYNRLSEKRERISGYCTSREQLEAMKKTMTEAKAKDRLYLNLKVVGCPAEQAL